MYNSYTCHHDDAHSRKPIVQEHRTIFGPSHRVVTIGNPSIPEFLSYYDYIQKQTLSSSYYELISNTLALNLALSSIPRELQSMHKLLEVFNIVRCDSKVVAHLSRPKVLSKAEVSLCMKHRYALSLLLLDCNSDFGIILEDDANPTKYSVKLLEQIVSFAGSYDPSLPIFIDLSSGCNLNISNIVDASYSTLNGGLYKPILPSSRTTCAYLVNKQFAALFLTSFRDPVAPIDYELTFILELLRRKKSDLICLWHEPAVFIHGSKDGTLSTLLT